MAVQLNHTIVLSRDKQASAGFLTEILGLPEPTRFGPFLVVELHNGVSLDFYETDGEIASQHYAFLISETEFDECFARIRERGIEYWADPGQRRPGEINHDDGGRGLYFEEPNGHLLEIITRLTAVLTRADAMKYLCLVYLDEQHLEELSDEDGVAYDTQIRDSGRCIASEALESVHTAATVRMHDGRVSVVDGPFAETKEQLAGFYLIEARDLNEALRIAAKIPPAIVSSIEVRPVRESVGATVPE